MMVQKKRDAIHFKNKANLRYFKVGDNVCKKVIASIKLLNVVNWKDHAKLST